jgi:hypothetical protein
MADFGHELRFGTFILWTHDAGAIERFGTEVASALTDAVAHERRRSSAAAPAEAAR